MHIAIWILKIIALAYLGLCAALFIFQRSLIYYPQPSANDDPTTKLKLTVPDAELLVSVRPRPGTKALIYFGGNAEDVSFGLPLLTLAFPDHALYLLHYRGYGGSTETPTEAALHSDALALYDKVRVEHPDIVIIGRSLGSGVAIRLAGQRPASRLILVTPYDSIQEIAARQFPYVPVSWLLLDKYESWRHASAIRIPTLLIAAQYDEVIPAASTERLLAGFQPGIASFKMIRDAGHNTISDSPEYLAALRGVF